MRRWYKLAQYHIRAFFIRCLSFWVRRERVPNDGIDFNSCRVLFLCQNRIGDALVATPVFRILKNHYPDIQLDVLLGRRNQEVLANHALITVRHIFKVKKLDVFTVLKRIRKIRYDYLVDFTVSRSSTSTIFCLLSSASINVGLQRENDFVYDLKYPALLEKSRDNPRPRMTQTFAQVLRAFAIDPGKQELQTEFTVIPSSRDFAKINRQRIVNGTTNLLIGINIAASKREKYWGTERFIKLINQLKTDMPGSSFMVLYSADYEIEARAIESRGPALCSDVTLSLSDFAAVVQSLDLLVTPDSAAVHLADTVALPVVVLSYEPAASTLWHPGRSNYRLLSSQSGSLQNISVDQVESAVLEIRHEQ